VKLIDRSIDRSIERERERERERVGIDLFNVCPQRLSLFHLGEASENCDSKEAVRYSLKWIN